MTDEKDIEISASAAAKMMGKNPYNMSQTLNNRRYFKSTRKLNPEIKKSPLLVLKSEVEAYIANPPKGGLKPGQKINRKSKKKPN
jgi:hypothetical protein